MVGQFLKEIPGARQDAGIAWCYPLLPCSKRFLVSDGDDLEIELGDSNFLRYLLKGSRVSRSGFVDERGFLD